MLPQEQHEGISFHIFVKLELFRFLLLDYILPTRQHASLVTYNTVNCYIFLLQKFESLTDQALNLSLPDVN